MRKNKSNTKIMKILGFKSIVYENFWQALKVGRNKSPYISKKITECS